MRRLSMGAAALGAVAMRQRSTVEAAVAMWVAAAAVEAAVAMRAVVAAAMGAEGGITKDESTNMARDRPSRALSQLDER
jgi:hypothetical protein